MIKFSCINICNQDYVVYILSKSKASTYTSTFHLFILLDLSLHNWRSSPAQRYPEKCPQIHTKQLLSSTITWLEVAKSWSWWRRKVNMWIGSSHLTTRNMVPKPLWMRRVCLPGIATAHTSHLHLLLTLTGSSLNRQPGQEGMAHFRAERRVPPSCIRNKCDSFFDTKRQFKSISPIAIWKIKCKDIQ